MRAVIMKILTISGSLRSASSNTAVLQALERVAPSSVRVTQYAGLGSLPHFNPDLDGDHLPEHAAELREEVAASDALVISSPEYAHGVPGSLKNALDWLVGSLDFAGKPVALINTAARAIHAQASLRETLQTMAARIIDEASITLALPTPSPDAGTIAADPGYATALRGVIGALIPAIESVRDDA